MTNLILAGTAKGLIEFTQEGDRWKLSKIHFSGFPVSMVHVDRTSGKWWVSLDHKHWGTKLHYSSDQGSKWKEADIPVLGSQIPGENKKSALKKIWVMENGSYDKPGTYWMGTEPGALFFSNSDGKQFELVESLWNHPSRNNESQWFGAGRDYPFIHSIVVDPRDHKHVYIAVSCAGIFETHDGGKSWNVKNNGLVATYLPNPNVEVGHDPHCLLCCRANPDVLWQQNHCGIFRSIDAGANWKQVSSPDTIPHYGFALAIDEEDPLQAWVVPVESDSQRVAADYLLAVYHTKDGGKTWNSQSEGLPKSLSFDIVLRQGLAKVQNILAFGTNAGNLYVSVNSGEKWQKIHSNLPLVSNVAILRI